MATGEAAPVMWLDAPVTVTAVHVEGLQATSDSFIEPLLAPILQNQGQGTISETLTRTQDVCQTLERLGIFSSVSITLDTADESVLRPKDARRPIQVTIDVTEATRLKASAQTGVRGSEGFMDFSGSLRNTLGGAETLEASLSYGLDSTQVGSVTDKPPIAPSGFLFSTLFSKPLLGNPDSLCQLSLYKQVRGRQRHLGHDEELTGLLAKWKRLNGFYGDHEVSYEAQWRHNLNLSVNAPWSLRQDAGHSLKSSLSHSLTFDGRDSSIVPTRGYFVRTLEELAGLGGDVHYVKTELEGQQMIPLGPFVRFPLCNHFCLNTHYKAHPAGRPRINDKFFLGGPLSIRGFEPFGLGPKENGFSLGGDVFWAGGLSLFTPLPYLNDETFKGHVFANAGHLIGIDRARSLADHLTQLTAFPSLSVGFGLIVNFSFLRVECNYTLPLRRNDTDEVKPGIQLGVGVSFM